MPILLSARPGGLLTTLLRMVFVLYAVVRVEWAKEIDDFDLGAGT
jgi:hypothetical protein